MSRSGSLVERGKYFITGAALAFVCAESAGFLVDSVITSHEAKAKNVADCAKTLGKAAIPETSRVSAACKRYEESFKPRIVSTANQINDPTGAPDAGQYVTMYTIPSYSQFEADHHSVFDTFGTKVSTPIGHDVLLDAGLESGLVVGVAAAAFGPRVGRSIMAEVKEGQASLSQLHSA